MNVSITQVCLFCLWKHILHFIIASDQIYFQWVKCDSSHEGTENF